MRRKPWGARTAQLRAEQTPGIEPIRMFPASTKSTLPPTQWAIPAAQSRIAAWKMSVPTTRCGVRRKTAISDDRDQRAASRPR